MNAASASGSAHGSARGSASAKPLAGWRVLVPRGGPWGDAVAADLRSKGASPIVAAMINFAPTADAPALDAALTSLAAGRFDWMTVTSATTVDVLSAQRAVVPPTTKVAAVGETTAAALTAAGYKVDLVPSEENSARGLLAEWEAATQGVVPLRILTLRSEIAKPLLTEGLRRIGHSVESVVAYRTIGVPVPENVAADVAAGAVQAILVTSGSVAEQVQLQLGPIPEQTLVAAIGPQTARDARDFGLRVDLIAEERTAASLIDAVADVARARAAH
ncbi:uroporphyrinogen-III synthase [Diaminobutyricibacter tongyongensis]|uniref:Uroporphyrinogen-III synthase n=1 Tax=Leifsonia tongyongensis TaxID=1268043 RepID=A0A6L9XWG6_9MICO|nr:uroporphyrinogen-III synthase [Diaminobutyricibacter tongyongensis]NEN05547.1 uroporphyrinogen-III synthase [Diaminobutyricibacter tongyongensis]